MIPTIKGNLLDFPNGITVIAHGCNTQGKMKSGLAKSIVELWPKVAEVDQAMHEAHKGKN
jgi:O-acetyl-ADP-ribose deacetylase (regulator of RNase III)